MKIDVLTTISNKENYMVVLEAVSGVKTEFTSAEKERLLAIYQDNAKNKLGVDDETLVKAILAIDVPGANLLNEGDTDALEKLTALCGNWTAKPELAVTAKTAALAGTASTQMSMALARAALDVMIRQEDISAYRKDIEALSAFLSKAEDEEFENVSVFLIRVRERMR